MTRVREFVGSNPGTVYWMDMKFFHNDMWLKLYCLKRPKINKKRPGLAHLKTDIGVAIRLSVSMIRKHRKHKNTNMFT